MDAPVHLDGGLIGSPNAAHISAALQALIHVKPFRSLLEEDTHRSKCLSLLRCLICPLKNALVEMKATGMASLEIFEKRWSNLSCAMSAELKGDPHEVLHTFLFRIRADLCETLQAQCCNDHFHKLSPITQIFEGEQTLQVSCDSCGDFSQERQFFMVQVTGELNDDLSGVLHSHFYKLKEELCMQCCKEQAYCASSEGICLPPILIVHCALASPNFKLQGRFAFEGHEYTLLGCIVDNSEGSFFISFCPDGKVRVFKNSKITVTVPGRVYIAEYLTTSKLTLLYSKIEKIQKTTKKSSTAANKQVQDTTKVKIVSYSVVHEDDILVEPQKYRTIGTQTEVNESVRSEVPREKLVTRLVNPAKRKPIKKLQMPPLICYKSCKNNKKFQFFTGLSQADFEVLYMLIGGDKVVRHLKLFYSMSTPKKAIASKLTGRDRLFILLLRMRRGLPLEELAFVFSCSVAYMGEICYVMTRLVYLTLKGMETFMFVPAARQCEKKPDVMKPFPNLRVILDGASFYVQTPSNFEQQGNTFSNYKKNNVVLFAIGISSHGATIFCSDGFEGSMSDKQTIIQSGLLDMLEPGDGVMTDRGYELTAELQAKGCHFYKPPSLGDRENLTAEEEILTKALASARIYVEHAIADIKDWRILQGTIPLLLLPVLSDLVYIAAFLRNFNPNRVGNKKFKSVSTEKQGNGDGEAK